MVLPKPSTPYLNPEPHIQEQNGQIHGQIHRGCLVSRRGDAHGRGPRDQGLYIYVYICVCIYIHMYIYIYIDRGWLVVHQEKRMRRARTWAPRSRPRSVHPRPLVTGPRRSLSLKLSDKYEPASIPHHISKQFPLQKRCPPRQKSSVRRLKAKVEPLLT